MEEGSKVLIGYLVWYVLLVLVALTFAMLGELAWQVALSSIKILFFGVLGLNARGILFSPRVLPQLSLLLSSLCSSSFSDSPPIFGLMQPTQTRGIHVSIFPFDS